VALGASVLAVPLLAEAKLSVWHSITGLNCYTDARQGYVGANIVSENTNPIVRHRAKVQYQSLQDCQAACLAEPSCEGICMQDQVQYQPTCFLRKNINLHACTTQFSDFTVWLRPGSRATADIPSSSGVMPSLLGVTCPSKDMVQLGDRAGLSLAECENECRTHPKCNAVEYVHLPKDVPARVGVNCKLLLLYGMAGCEHGAGHVELRFVAGKRSEGVDAWTAPTSTAVPAASTVVHRLPTTSVARQWTTSVAKAAAAHVPSQVMEAWASRSSMNCFPGHGGDELDMKLFSPVHERKTLQDCQALCLKVTTCTAIVMSQGTGAAESSNCWLRKEVRAFECEPDDDMAVFVKPGVQAVGFGDWVTYSGTNCHSGSGADEAVDGMDVLPGHMKLGDCERKCDETAGCEAVVFEDTTAWDSSNCYLRKNLVLRQCDGAEKFNLRMRRKFMKAYADTQVALGSAHFVQIDWAAQLAVMVVGASLVVCAVRRSGWFQACPSSERHRAVLVMYAE